MHGRFHKLRCVREMAADDLMKGRIEVLIQSAKDFLRSACTVTHRHWYEGIANGDAGTGGSASSGNARSKDEFRSCMDILVRRIEALAHRHATDGYNRKFLLDKASALKSMLAKGDDLDRGAVEFHLNILLLRMLTIN